MVEDHGAVFHAHLVHDALVLFFFCFLFFALLPVPIRHRIFTGTRGLHDDGDDSGQHLGLTRIILAATRPTAIALAVLLGLLRAVEILAAEVTLGLGGAAAEGAEGLGGVEGGRGARNGVVFLNAISHYKVLY